MNANELADMLAGTSGDFLGGSAMLRKQAEAIKQLREALEDVIADVKHEMSDGYMESIMHSTSYHAAKAALAATENL